MANGIRISSLARLSRAPPTSEREEEVKSTDGDWLRFLAFLYVFSSSRSKTSSKIDVSLKKNQEGSFSFSLVAASLPTMDPERVRAYLQVACAGLGFDIGEVWWTSNENGSSTVAAIGR